MDVICVFDAEGTPYCTEFYIKFKSPLVDEAALSTLGAHEDAGLIDMVFPTEEHEATALNSAAKAHQNEHPLQRSDYVQISCNGRICNEVRAFVGKDYMLHFFDEIDGSYAPTPSPNVLKCMYLSLGKNIISCIHFGSNLAREFSIWRYESSDRLVIMDIDGTITKSDVTGYIQTVYMGLFSYVHDGIVPFMNALKNIYGLSPLYLTARPLAHQRETKRLLEGVKDRSGQRLPDGPLLPNKDRLLAALYREMISKTTMELKTHILNAVSRVFGMAGCTRRTPFALGIGNKEADAQAYNLAGLNAESILLINKASRIEVWKYQHLAKMGFTGPSTGRGAEGSALQRSRSDDFQSSKFSVQRPALADRGIAVAAAEGEFTDSSSDGADSPMLHGSTGTPRGAGEGGSGQGQGAGSGSPRAAAVGVESGAGGPSSPGSSGGSGGRGMGLMRGVVRAFSHNVAVTSSSGSGSSGAGSAGQQEKASNSSDDLAVVHTGRGRSTGTGSGVRGGGSGSESEYIFHTYGDPRLLQYVQSVAQL